MVLAELRVNDFFIILDNDFDAAGSIYPTDSAAWRILGDKYNIEMDGFIVSIFLFKSGVRKLLILVRGTLPSHIKELTLGN